MQPTRPLPRIGARADIAHFGGTPEAATITAISDGGRAVTVRDSGGVARRFTLRRATAAYVLAGEQHSPRLRLL